MMRGLMMSVDGQSGGVSVRKLSVVLARVRRGEKLRLVLGRKGRSVVSQRRVSLERSKELLKKVVLPVAVEEALSLPVPQRVSEREALRRSKERYDEFWNRLGGGSGD